MGEAVNRRLAWCPFYGAALLNTHRNLGVGGNLIERNWARNRRRPARYSGTDRGSGVLRRRHNVTGRATAPGGVASVRAYRREGFHSLSHSGLRLSLLTGLADAHFSVNIEVAIYGSLGGFSACTYDFGAERGGYKRKKERCKTRSWQSRLKRREIETMAFAVRLGLIAYEKKRENCKREYIQHTSSG